MRRGLKKLVGSTVIVHSRGPSIRGVLLAAHRDCLVVGHAYSLDDKAKLAGESVIPLVNGVWVQANLPEEDDA